MVGPIIAQVLVAACSVQRSPPLNYEADREALAYLVLRDSWAEVTLHRYRHAYASPYGAVFHEGSVEPGPLDYSLLERQKASTFRKKIILGRVKRVSGPSVVCHNTFYRNYYHWLLEALPRLYCLRDDLAGRSLILHQDLEAFHLQSLALFGLAGVIQVRRDELALVDDLLCPGPLSKTYGQHNPGHLAGMSAWIQSRVGVATGRTAGARRVHIVRGGDKRRCVANGDEVAAMLAARGFEQVVLETLSFEEQVRLFSKAEAVASIHGAGLANALFMPPGGTVIEFVSQDYPDGCLFNLAAACGHRSLVFVSKTTGPKDRSGPKYYDVTVDTKKVSRVMKSLGF